MVDLDRWQLRLQLLDEYTSELRRLRDLDPGGYAREAYAGRYLVLTGRLRALAGLRNRLVHVYDRIDDERVHAALVDGLTDIDVFAVAVTRYATPEAGRG